MTERNTGHTPHSVHSLLYVEVSGKPRGYKRDLLREQVTDSLQQFLFCPECSGVIREAVQSKGRTVCQACTAGLSGDSDRNVQANVPLLKCRCPLSLEGCGWSGEIGSIREHMDTCLKLLIECSLECGAVLERGGLVEHQREVCPTRKKLCEYCGQNIQAGKENTHTRVCSHNPEGEVACPYKEIGCDTVWLLRKHLERHLTENTLVHHKLILVQFQQQQSSNKQMSELRDRLRSVEQTHSGRSETRGVWRLLLIFAILTVGISALVLYQMENSQRLEKEIIILRNEMERKETHLNSVLASVADLEIRIGQFDQVDLLKQLRTLSERLPPIGKYISERGKILQGVPWTHDWIATEQTIDGPSFYLTGLCKLRLHVKFPQINGRFQPRYFVTRITGDYEEVIGRCHISYIYHLFENLETGIRSTMLGEYKRSDLEVGEQLYIHYFIYEMEFKSTGLVQKDKLTVKVYFDTKENI